MHTVPVPQGPAGNQTAGFIIGMRPGDQDAHGRPKAGKHPPDPNKAGVRGGVI
jgi:hypothetical protein